MSKDKTTLDLQQIKTELQNMSHSTKPLRKSITAVADKLLGQLNSQNKGPILAVLNDYVEVAKLLSQSSRKWTISMHWAFTVCNPKINDKSNPAYSPVYIKHQCRLPPDCPLLR